MNLPADRLAIVSAPGSRGDVNPMLKLAARLHQRGWSILFVTSETYAPLARQLGFDVHCLIDASQFQQFIQHEDLWKWFRGTRYLLRESSQIFLDPMYDLLVQRVRPGRTVVIHHPLDFGSRVYRDAHPEVPLVSVHLAPCLLRSPSHPPKMTPLPFELRRPAAAVRAMYWLADQLFVARWLAPQIDRLRRRLGLPHVRRPVHQWWLSPDLVLALFPSWFLADGQVLPPRMHPVGFPLADLPELISDSPAAPTDEPVVFTAGTAHAQSRRFFEAAIEAAVQLKTPAVMLTHFRDQLPRELPDGIRWHPYVAFSQWLPKCRAIVHHGGIGTTSISLAAGCPQLVLPMAFDQFDNAERVVRVGAGRTVPMAKATAPRLARELRSLLGEPRYHEQSMACSRAIESELDPIDRASDLIEQLAHHSSDRPS